MVSCSKCGREIEELGRTGQSICSICGHLNQRSINSIVSQSHVVIEKPSSSTKLKIPIIASIVIILLLIGSGVIPFRQTSPPPGQPNSFQDIRGWAFYSLDWFTYEHGKDDYSLINDDVYKICAIFSFVYTEIEYVSDPHGQDYFQKPSETLMYKKGDCDDYAILMAALCESVGMDASIEYVEVTGNGASNEPHMICTVYYDGSSDDFMKTQNQIWDDFGLTQSDLGITYFDSIHPLWAKNGDDWEVIDKYERGIWVTLEKWESILSIDRYDIEYSTCTSNEALQELFNVITYGAFPGIEYRWECEWTDDTAKITVDVTNTGVVRAKNVIVWTGFDGGNNTVYNQGKSNEFHLSPKESHVVTLSQEIPLGVRTRILLSVWGDNFDVIESESDWFEFALINIRSAETKVCGDKMTISMILDNDGEVTAKNVVVWTGFDAGGDKVFTQQQSNPFELSPQETREVILQIKIPSRVHTRMLFRIWGDNLIQIENESEWFDT